MNAPNDEKIRTLLKNTFPPVAEAEPGKDLWPAILRRLDQEAIHVPWFDWVLVAGLAALLVAFPEVIPVLLYHL